jgi:ketosteroid isomerase-like protein
MTHPNLDLIEQFFAAYAARDLAGLRAVLAEDAIWTFPGQHPLGGTKQGIDAIVAFFDAMGAAVGGSQPHIERLVLGVNDQYVAECQHLRTQRAGGPNLDQPLCVLWRFAHGKIVSGQHLVADQAGVDMFFTAGLA